MATLDELINKYSNINAAIDDALRTEVADVVRDAIVESARENVYEPYVPKFMDSRRNGNGGILDKNSILVEVSNNELTAIDTLPGVSGYKGWQQKWRGDVPSGRLAEAIASGDRKYNMHLAGPRPFHDAAKEKILTDGTAEAALRKGLERQGYKIDRVSLT